MLVRSQRDFPHRAREQQVHQLLCVRTERHEVLEGGAPPLGIPGTQRRRNDRLENSRLAVGGRPKCPEVPRVESEAGKLAARRGDLHVELAVELSAAAWPRL